MKRLYSLYQITILLAVIVLSFFSCGKEEEAGIATVSFKVNSLMEVENATAALLININIDDPTHSGGTINVSITGGTYGTDYETSTGGADFSLEVAPNSLLASFSVQPLNDELIEDDLPLTITITSITGSLAEGETTEITLTIIDDDKAPDPVRINFSTPNNSISESGGTETVTLILNEPLIVAATVDVVLSSATIATIGSDFDLNGSNSTLTLQLDAGATEASFDINIVDDMDMEDSEELVLELANPSAGLLIGASLPQFTLTIVDNDSGVPPIDYFEDFESNDETSTYLSDVLGFQNVLLNQTIGDDKLIGLVLSAGNFSDADDVTMPSDNGLNIFYTSDQDPTLFGELDNVVISPLMEGQGLIEVNMDIAYAFKNQNAATVTFYWSENYNGSGTFNESDWTILKTETAEEMDTEGFGNNTYKREVFDIEPSQSFYIAIRVTQTIDDEFYRTRWRFDNLSVSN